MNDKDNEILWVLNQITADMVRRSDVMHDRDSLKEVLSKATAKAKITNDG